MKAMIDNGWSARAFVLLLLLTLAACATAPPEREPEPVAAEPREPLDADGAVRHVVDNEAVALLWEQAEEARAEGQYRSAISALERALRAAPEDPVLWSRLAELQLLQGEHAVAENFAAKSNALAGDNRLLHYRNWLLIGEAREQRGDERGAAAARVEADRLRAGN